jgi:hypothetical protein
VPLLESFDVASADSPAASRNVTTVAPQALILLNSDFLNEQSAALAARILVGNALRGVPSPTEQVTAAYRLALGREPTEREQTVALAFLEREITRWSQPDMLATLGGDGEQSTDVQLVGWKHFAGQWRKRDDGGCQVEAHPGAKIVRGGLSFDSGTVEAQVMLLDGGGDAGLIVRVNDPTNGTDALTAYNINLRKDSLRLGKHENNYQQLASVKTDISPDQWHDVRATFDGARIRIWLDGGKEPLIDFTDPKPLAAGSVGFRTYQIQSAVRQIRLTRNNRTEDVPMEYAEASTAAPSSAHSRALAELCKLVLNLNEFIYID